jgi:hypothetical protein
MSAVVTGPFYVIDVFCSNNTVRVHFFHDVLGVNFQFNGVSKQKGNRFTIAF